MPGNAPRRRAPRSEKESSSPSPAAAKKKAPAAGARSYLSEKKGLTFEDRLEIVRRREAGETMVAIAARFGVSRQNVAQILDKHRKEGVEGLEVRFPGRPLMRRLSEEEIEHLRGILAEHERPSDYGVRMSRLKNVWFYESLKKLIQREFRISVPIVHGKEICRALRIPQTINMGLLNPVRIAEGRENHPGYSKNLAKSASEPASAAADELCGDIPAIQKELELLRKKGVTAKKRPVAKKGFRVPPKGKATGKAKVRHSKKRKRK